MRAELGDLRGRGGRDSAAFFLQGLFSLLFQPDAI